MRTRHLARVRQIHDRLPANHRRGREAQRQALAQHNQIGGDADVFPGEEFARPSATRLNLVKSQQDLMLSRQASSLRPKSRGIGQVDQPAATSMITPAISSGVMPRWLR